MHEVLSRHISQQDHPKILNIVIVGHVDHGKSTLLGGSMPIRDRCRTASLKRSKPSAGSRAKNSSTRSCLTPFWKNRSRDHDRYGAHFFRLERPAVHHHRCAGP